MYWILFAVGLFIAVALEATGIALPWVLMLLLLATVVTKKEWLFFVALGAGLVLDSVTFRPLGESSLFFVCLLGLIFAYENKFEIQSIGFVGGISALGSIVYALSFGLANVFVEVILTTAISTIGFFAISLFVIKPEKW